MKIFRQSLNPESVYRIVKGELVQKKAVELKSIADPKSAEEHSIVFLENEKYLPLVFNTMAGLIIAASKFKEELKNHRSNIIFTDKPYQSILILMHFWLQSEKDDFKTAVHPTAIIGSNVNLPDKIIIGPYSVIGNEVVLGEYTVIDAFCAVGSHSRIGKYCHLYPNVIIYEDTEIGNNVDIHSGCVIGADGFGYILFDNIQQKIPQIGQVIIHDNVEIGANTTVDRGTIGPTIIGEGTKIDNLVQIGHNCTIGKHSILCAQVGLAGSSNLGDYVYLAGQVGLAGHLNIGDKTMVGAQSGVASDLEAGKLYLGYPAREAMLAKKIMAVENSLPEMYKLFNKIKKEREQE